MHEYARTFLLASFILFRLYIPLLLGPSLPPCTPCSTSIRNSHNFTHEVISQHPHTLTGTHIDIQRHRHLQLLLNFHTNFSIRQTRSGKRTKKHRTETKEKSATTKKSIPYMRQQRRGVGLGLGLGTVGSTGLSTLCHRKRTLMCEKNTSGRLEQQLEILCCPWPASCLSVWLASLSVRPSVCLLAQFECAGAYIIPVDRTILLSAQSQHNSRSRSSSSSSRVTVRALQFADRVKRRKRGGEGR